MKYLLLLLLLAGCGGATVMEEWPSGSPPEPVGEPEKKEYIVLESEPVITQTFSVVQGQPVTFVLREQNHTMELFAVEEERARMRVDNISFIMGINQTATRSGVTITIEEAVRGAVPVPRRSVTDVTIGNLRQRLYPGQTVTVGNDTVLIDFIGLKNDEPHVRVVMDDRSVVLAKNGEHRFDNFWVYVHNIDFNDATEYNLVDAITVRVR